MKRLSISDDVIKLGVFVAMAEVSNVDARVSQQALDDMIKNVEEKYRSQDPEYLKNDSVVRAYRDFYWRIGIDPTKTRPSGEALRRRLARGNRFPRINIVVDIGNIVSVETLVPIGLYDREKVMGDLHLVMSKGSEEFLGLGKKTEKLDKGIPILVDDEGKVLHIYPHRDSILTSITPDVKNVIIVGAGVPNIDENLVKYAVDRVADLLEKICKGKREYDTVVIK
ncbi:B3/B4 domain-containing protein [Saccharolobus islandicus]|uniref:B3/B4 tRNA-binding domain-containing protein n=6 Tax=Saccharolobus islandicus TaxID=43080 RepID=M9U735_SACIS|nr:B3/4 domain-containing protein [Sulfolobus islandicus]ACP38229.1 B3/4 domain protein [Sulfolobus islandicus M.14.25]ACP55475.1 B3/4 domain protein [Sulfolobus islandicus M.16.27]ACR42077.1 B3/4 domain protein [Sulfolobus islandicus M.16.4]ADX82792.1 B3/4 domain protein [Sulfolobus islandicus HVE10/4]ADX85422.1 B3/4 domain protein [Sulfolobus islandicus REY15A]